MGRQLLLVKVLVILPTAVRIPSVRKYCAKFRMYGCQFAAQLLLANKHLLIMVRTATKLLGLVPEQLRSFGITISPAMQLYFEFLLPHNFEPTHVVVIDTPSGEGEGRRSFRICNIEVSPDMKVF